MWNNSNNPLQSCWHTITIPLLGLKSSSYNTHWKDQHQLSSTCARLAPMFPNPITFRGMCLLPEEVGWKSANMLRGKLLNKYSKDVTLEYIQKRQELLPNTICNFTQNQECTPGKENAYLLTTCCSLSLSNLP